MRFSQFASPGVEPWPHEPGKKSPRTQWGLLSTVEAGHKKVLTSQLRWFEAASAIRNL